MIVRTGGVALAEHVLLSGLDDAAEVSGDASVHVAVCRGAVRHGPRRRLLHGCKSSAPQPRRLWACVGWCSARPVMPSPLAPTCHSPIGL